MRHNLPYTADAYNSGSLTRPAWDPIGRGCFPDRRSGLNALVGRMITILKTDRDWVTGGTLGRHVLRIEGPGLGARRIRQLVKYARQGLRIDQIVGFPGLGYAWIEPDTGRGKEIRRAAWERLRAMGRHHFALASMLSESSAAKALAQLTLDFMDGDGADANTDPDGEVAAILAAQGARPVDLVSELVTMIGRTEDGRRQLAEIGRKHSDILLPAEIRRTIEAALADVDRQVSTVRRMLSQDTPEAA